MKLVRLNNYPKIGDKVRSNAFEEGSYFEIRGLHGITNGIYFYHGTLYKPDGEHVYEDSFGIKSLDMFFKIINCVNVPKDEV